jgi:flavin reductase (DIM6/NTAB) family NADH-FMN oxidoreductase RutF
VITTRTPEGEPKGLTATAFTSLSLDPPRILVCVSTRSHTYPALMTEGAAFAVNMLRCEQEGIADIFASKRDDKFLLVDVEDGLLGVPVLKNTLAHLECRVVARYPGGDHVILVASVEHLASDEQGEPLLFYRGQYTGLATRRPARPRLEIVPNGEARGM